TPSGIPLRCDFGGVTMMLIPRERIVQRGRRRLSMEPLCLENHHLVKTLKVNQVHQRQKGSSGPEKIVMSLYKIPAIIFPVDDIEEITSRWEDNLHQEYNDLGKSA
nr:hypothetical protein [Tanacetum cinerariifolium]